ncbi:hypothetical protein B0H16DRAFT_532226 [Mycena metata]|uniref:Uncharacterized protein n=1 Tax=Mycena metata TaxID=1033252 RepID=A0AAD7H8G2_9AGAR|nr:hypothetical protein B0H16DRAFT_532226 [Mycena metata]
MLFQSLLSCVDRRSSKTHPYIHPQDVLHFEHPRWRLPADLIKKLAGMNREEVPTVAPHIYFVTPALPVFGNPTLVPNCEAILAHWLTALTDMASRADGSESGVIVGAPDGSIPGGSAVLWSAAFSLGQMACSPCADFGGHGVHAILVPRTLKRSAPDSIEGAPAKKRNASGAPRVPFEIAIDTAITNEEIRQEIIEQVDAVLRAVKLQDAIDHDPSATTDLPLSSIHARMPQWGGRFRISVRGVNNTPYYSYRGRNILDGILTRIRRLGEARGGYLTLGLFGTKGSGKAHVATAAASHLLRAGSPVVFLPFSRTAPTTAEIRDAILLALRVGGKYAEHVPILFNMCVKYPDEHGGVIRFCNHLQNRGIQLIFVALTLDALSEKDAMVIRSMTKGHILLFTASANSAACRDVESEIGFCPGWDYQAVYMNGGLDDDEIGPWFDQYENESENPAALFNSRQKTRRSRATSRPF